MATGYSVGNLELAIQTVGNGAVTSLTLTNSQLKQMYRLLGGSNNALNKMGGNFNKTFSFAKTLGKLYFIRNYSKQLMQTMSSLVQSAIDYTETLNLWQVAMRGNLETAEEFISKMNKAYGIAEETLMRYQATFRNMLATLGGVSTDVSYALSEYLTQMALDYASLYNTSIEKAMTVFQSVLSGQVRPIRSISGYDITETTIFELYQQLGGTKTMRQLTQTEKRLLRIYAVFQQMDRSGAIGDLNKTLNNTANQMRIMSEATKELGTWVGKFFEMYLADYLPYINAALIVAKDIAKAVVQSLPNYQEFDGTIAGFEETADAIDEVQGKLLDFDKFRSLSGGEETNLGIDANLISGLTRYESILGNVTNKATKIAEQWKLASGLWDENGVFNLAKWEQIKDDAKDILDSIKNIALLLVGKKFATSIASMANAFGSFGSLKGLALGALIAGFIKLSLESQEFRDSLISIWDSVKEPLVKLYKAFIDIASAIAPIVAKIIEVADELGLLEPIIKTIIGYAITKKIYGLSSGILKLIPSFKSFTAQMTLCQKALIGTSLAFAGLSLVNFLSTEMSAGQRIVSIFIALATAIGAAAIAMHAFKMDWAGAIAIGATVAGGVLTISSALSNVQVRKNGGLVEDGVFTMNKGEVMGTFDDGTSIVANNQQIISGIKQGVYQAVSSALQANGSHDDRPIDIYIDGERVFQATKKNAKRHGLAFSKV